MDINNKVKKIMKSLELLALGLRLVGIYALIRTIQAALSTYHITVATHSSLGQLSAIDVWFVYAVPLLVCLLLFLLCFLLIRYPTIVAKKLLPATSSLDDTPISQRSDNEIVAIAFRILGVYVLAFAIPRLLQLILLIGYYWRDPQAVMTLHDPIIEVAAIAVEIIIGLFLCLGASWFSMLLGKARRAGIK